MFLHCTGRTYNSIFWSFRAVQCCRIPFSIALNRDIDSPLDAYSSRTCLWRENLPLPTSRLDPPIRDNKNCQSWGNESSWRFPFQNDQNVCFIIVFFPVIPAGAGPNRLKDHTRSRNFGEILASKQSLYVITIIYVFANFDVYSAFYILLSCRIV